MVTQTATKTTVEAWVIGKKAGKNAPRISEAKIRALADRSVTTFLLPEEY